MSDMQVNAAVSSWQSQSAAQAPREQEKEDPSFTIYEMMKEAREKADATRDKFNSIKPKPRYGDAPMEAYARLARARRPAEVNAAAGYARRQIARLRAAKQTDPDNAKRIQAAINQLQKAVQRAGKKNRDLERERVAQARQKKLQQEKRSREARRQKQELLRKQAMRRLRESGYLREAEIDNRMQAHIAAVDMELREQMQKLESSIQPSMELVAKQYAADSAAMALPEETAPAPAGGEIDLQA
ncbi:hypothetical protein [uncultured Oscillibacter sp.]|uniref:hypothetical protein n=1 Tax=uncultured Oscillibacter sp. TaxID=876091 RepID=UPI00272EB1CF|nr:hypothetical protein [uncultured Oscillibacter sp.]